VKHTAKEVGQDELFHRLKAGDERVVLSLYEQYRSSFLSWSQKRYGISEEDAADCFQDAVIALWNNVMNGKLEDLQSSLKTYLFSIGKNYVLTKIRKDTREPVWTEELEEMKRSDLPDPEALYLGNERVRVVADLVETLSEPCKSILRYYYYKRFSMEAIAETMQYKNADTVKSQKLRCVKELQEKAGRFFADL
jgi:RNA polymerase sigma factor (sigma-70 family)